MLLEYRLEKYRHYLRVFVKQRELKSYVVSLHTGKIRYKEIFDISAGLWASEDLTRDSFSLHWGSPAGASGSCSESGTWELPPRITTNNQISRDH